MGAARAWSTSRENQGPRSKGPARAAARGKPQGGRHPRASWSNPFLHGRNVSRRRRQRRITPAKPETCCMGCARGNGKVVSAMRVGPDTTTLPVRLLGDATNPPHILVLSADAETVTALDE